MYTLTYIRHAEQINHREIDPYIKDNNVDVNFNYDYIICSPYQRCRQTVNAINKFNKFDRPVYIDIQISEFQSHSHFNDVMDPSSLVYGAIPMHESWFDFIRRVEKHFAYVSTLRANILVVTHGLVVKHLDEKITGVHKYKRGRDVPFVSGFTITV